MGERLMPYTGPGEAQKEEITKIASDFSKAVEKHTLNGRVVEETRRARVTYSKPDGTYSSRISVEEPSFVFGPKGITFHYLLDKEKGLIREVEIEFESFPGSPAEVISSKVLNPEDVGILIKFAQDPMLYQDLSEHLLELKEEEKRILDQDRERHDRELEEIREDYFIH